MKSNYDILGNHIRLIDTRNRESITDRVLGINIDKFFMPSVANVIGTDLSKYKLITKGKFACNPMHVGRDERLPVALYDEEEPAIVSPAYFMFEVIDNSILNEDYLMMWFRRPEFDRICWLHTDGSVRGGITWDDICRLELPIPPIEKQFEIVNSYKAITERTDDIRCYLTEYQAKKKSSKVTIDNIRRILSSFFSWLEDEDYILKSPVRRIHKVKTGTNIKETYSDEALELMRDNCKELRDLAMIDMLASTGMRVGEMVLLNREDIDFNERECVVFGKGDKERIVYFDARTKIHLQNYLNSRKDDNPALFVSLQFPYNRMNIGGIEVRLRQLGKRLGLNKVHPHKFRRTLATMAIDKGMPIEQLQQLLGHKRIDTTLQYAMVKQSNVKIAHRKYIG